MSKFYDLAAFNSNEQYHFSSDSHSQNGEDHHSYSFGLGTDPFQIASRQVSAERPIMSPKHPQPQPQPSPQPPLPNATATDTTTPAVVSPIHVTAHPPAGPAPPRNGRAPSLEKGNMLLPPSVSMPTTPVANRTCTTAPASSPRRATVGVGAAADHTLVVLPRLSHRTVAPHAPTDAPGPMPASAAHTVAAPSAARTAPRLSVGGGGSVGREEGRVSSPPPSATKRTHAVPPLEPQSLDTAGAPPAAVPSGVPVYSDNNSAGTPSSGVTTPGTTAPAPVIPGWLAQVNTHLSVQPLPRVTTAPVPEPDSPRSSVGGGDSDWLNPRARPSTGATKSPFGGRLFGGYTASALGLSASAANSSGPASGPGTTTISGMSAPAKSAPASASTRLSASASAHSPATSASVASSDAASSQPRSRAPRAPPTLSFPETVTTQRRLSSSRRTSGAETPHMGLAALRSDSGSSTDPSDGTDAVSIDRDLSRVGMSGSNFEPSLHDGFVSIQHAQRHLTPSSQRGGPADGSRSGGSQLWSGESGASVANGHRQLPGGRRPGSEVWSGGGAAQRAPMRAHGAAPPAASSMPSRPPGAGSGGDSSADQHPDLGPVRVPRENNYFRRVSRDGSGALGPGLRLGSASTDRQAGGGRVQPLSLQSPHDEPPDEGSFTDLSSKVSGVSLNAETTYVTKPS